MTAGLVYSRICFVFRTSLNSSQRINDMFYTKSRHNVPVLGVSLPLILCVLAGCNDGSDNAPDAKKPQADNPVVEGPVTAGGSDDCCFITVLGFELDIRSLESYVPGTAFYGRPLLYDEAEVGYRETEYFFSGSAMSYVATDELGSDGIWSVATADAAEFKSRMVVDRPIDDADFNGTVVVEWFNVTAGLDSSPEWNQMHTELTREGYVWVGVSAQFNGIEENDAPFSIPLKLLDVERYGSLHHPGDSFSYDIFSQAAQAVRNPVGLDPLEGLQVERMIAVGQSQSAGRLVTYVNAVHPTIDLFDGFIIHSRGCGSYPLSEDPQVEVRAPNPAYIRTDLPEPVLALQSQTDAIYAAHCRQSDSAGYRLWEVAGAAHADLYTSQARGSLDKGEDPAIADVLSSRVVQAPFISCDLAINDGPGHWVAKAAIASVNRWIMTGEAAASAPLLQVNADATAYELDSLGNAKGGIRTPYVDAPVATFTGTGQPTIPGVGDFCRLYGITTLFDETQLSQLYPDKQAYINAIDTATDSAVNAGFLLPKDAELIKARARTSPLPAAHPLAEG
jgi:alpha/beta hydrolase family protein